MNRGTVCDCDVDLIAFGHEIYCKKFGPTRRLLAGQPPPAPTHELVAGRWVRLDTGQPVAQVAP